MLVGSGIPAIVVLDGMERGIMPAGGGIIPGSMGGIPIPIPSRGGIWKDIGAPK